MSKALIARRYASALFELDQENDPSFDRDMLVNVALFTAHEDAARVIESPTYSKESKATFVKAALKSNDESVVTRLVDLLAGRNKLVLLPEIVIQFDELVARAGCVLEAQVTVARTLTKRKQTSLTKDLKALVGSDVTLNVVQDPAILGGLVIQIGDRKIDCSIRGKLEGLRRTIAG
ncbi:MAG: F0F1 ATP synthase subunit delta [Mariprofundaceae bacterium]|nr:F0F1 ATP synthase subunit delta [Mariprofundaceae bacterium]